MNFKWLQLQAFLKGFRLYHIWRGENYVRVGNTAAKYEIILCKRRHYWDLFNENKTSWSSKIGLGETKQEAIQDAMPEIRRHGAQIIIR